MNSDRNESRISGFSSELELVESNLQITVGEETAAGFHCLRTNRELLFGLFRGKCGMD